MFRLLLSLALLLASLQAYGWGERGHDLVTRVAVRILGERSKHDAKVMTPFEQREHMLAHLSNVPDIVWRAMDKKTRDLNGPTHYVDIDLLVANPDYKSIPIPWTEAVKLAKKNNLDLVNKIGTAAWRIEQLWNEMVKYLKDAKAASKDPKAFETAVNQALVRAGIMSHFVGDLAQPLHTTSDYDGWAVNQGGVHSYFESQVVATYPLSFDNEVFEAARTGPFAKVVAQFQKVHANSNPLDALSITWALVVNSFSQLPELLEIDRKYAVQVASKTEPLKLPAQRAEPRSVQKAFASLAVSRLAMGADTLARLWDLAYKAAGQPDLASFHSYYYPVKQPFITPTYLPF